MIHYSWLIHNERMLTDRSPLPKQKRYGNIGSLSTRDK